MLKSLLFTSLFVARSVIGENCASDGSSSSIEVTISGNNRVIKTTGCPQYDWTGQTTPNTAIVQDVEFVIPLNPVVCEKPTSYIGVYTDLAKTTKTSNPVMGAVGVAFNGVALYGNVDATGGDAYVNEARTFNECNGHPTAFGQYHYHAEVPEDCHLQEIFDDQHAPLFGFMPDGIPIYGPRGDNGEFPVDLDECNGHVDSTHGFYHYHVTANMQYPYLVNCLKGKIDTTYHKSFRNQEPCTPVSQSYDYSPIYSAWIETDEAVTDAPTQAVTDAPTQAVTNAPTQAVTDAPTQAVTDAPTQAVTDAPTQAVTDAPTQAVTDAPTQAVTDAPTQAVTDAPTEAVTDAPVDAAPSPPVNEAPSVPTESSTDKPKDIAVTEMPTVPQEDVTEEQTVSSASLPMTSVIYSMLFSLTGISVKYF